MVKFEPLPAPTEIRLVLNWFEELRAKVPRSRQEAATLPKVGGVDVTRTRK